MSPLVLARLRDVPTRAFAAGLTFGVLLGMPGLLVALAAAFFALELEIVGVVLVLLAILTFIGAVVGAWVLIFKARSGLKRAEQALYAGDFDAATRSAHFVVRTVFRADDQMGALYTLALAAERIGAFKSGRVEQALHMFEYERASIDHGLAPHERALAERIRSEAARSLAGGGPHRAPAALAPAPHDMPGAWAATILPP